MPDAVRLQHIDGSVDAACIPIEDVIARRRTAVVAGEGHGADDLGRYAVQRVGGELFALRGDRRLEVAHREIGNY